MNNRHIGLVNTPLRVLQVRNFYRQAGGEDVVVANERALLMDHGNEVRLWSVSTGAIKGIWRKFQTAWQARYSPSTNAQLTCETAAFGSDVVHVHNFLPILTPPVQPEGSNRARTNIKSNISNGANDFGNIQRRHTPGRDPRKKPLYSCPR